VDGERDAYDDSLVTSWFSNLEQPPTALDDDGCKCEHREIYMMAVSPRGQIESHGAEEQPLQPRRNLAASPGLSAYAVCIKSDLSTF
jgi:hypothetical protein